MQIVFIPKLRESIEITHYELRTNRFKKSISGFRKVSKIVNSTYQATGRGSATAAHKVVAVAILHPVEIS